jgi:UDP-N-acetylenolpyruvoylglucosamine reductase
MTLINETVARGLGGLHHYVGIPSTVGGAIWQNLHFLSPPPDRERTCFIEEVVESAEILTAEGERQDRRPRLLQVRLRLQHPARPRRRRAQRHVPPGSGARRTS